MLNKVTKILAVISLSVMSQQTFASIVDYGSVYLAPEEGSWVGGGINTYGDDGVEWTHGEEGLFYINSTINYGAQIRFDDGNYWGFIAPDYDPITNTVGNQFLEIGFYDEATRHPFNSPTDPGLSFSGNGRGNNKLGGWFDVLDISSDIETLEILSLAIDFRQFDESEAMTGPSTFGSLRLNSDIPLNYTGEALSQVPVPAAVWLFGSGLIGLVGVARRRNIKGA